MFKDDTSQPESRDKQAQAAFREQRKNRSQGHVIECDGTRVVISATTPTDGSASPDYWKVGSLITVRAPRGLRTVGMLYKIESAAGDWTEGGKNQLLIHVELVGEVYDNDDGQPLFRGGVSAYPSAGAIAHRIRSADLTAIFTNNDDTAVRVGQLSQNRDIEARITINDLLARHFAVVGTTGVGKSTSVSLLVRKIVQVRPDISVLILDPHNEFASAFPDISETISDSTLDLPFWVFRLEEFVEVLFRGRSNKADPAEIDILRDLIPIAKQRFKGDEANGLRKQRSSEQYTADTPVPYRIADLITLINDRAGQLDQREHRLNLKALAARIKATVNDPRYRFMFANTTITDNLAEVLAHIYRVPHKGRPVTIFQLNGIPSEVVNAVVSVLCRLAFDLAVNSQAKVKTLVLCEEAHRYIPANVEAGFVPTRAAIARIAKEGRKYGVGLGIITQRPSELDATILSQCSTMFAMRLGNDTDQEIMRRAISGASRSYINFLPALANQEAVAFGEAVSTPIRLTFEHVPKKDLPANHLTADADASGTSADIHAVLHRMRDPGGDAEVDTKWMQDVIKAEVSNVHAVAGNGIIEDDDLDGETMVAQHAEIAEGTPRPSAQTSEALFSYDGPLRRTSDQPSSEPLQAGRRLSDPVVEPVRSKTSTRDLIGRFRK